MDIEYLLLLQSLREKTAWLIPVLSKFCDLNVVLLPAVCLFLYLSIDKRTGFLSLLCFNVSEIANLLVKNVCCVYRPYIKDTRLTPPAKSTSYSFPSGHTMYATSMYGVIGAWQQKRHKWITALCIALILVTGFARNYLGVHTPQDVIVSVVLTLLCMLLCVKLAGHIEEHPEKRMPAVLSGAAVGIAVLVFLCVKPYPMDYDAEGKLLVDPYKTQTEVFQCIGKWLGFLAGSVLDALVIRYEIPESKPVRYIGGTAGGLLCFIGAIVLRKIKTLPLGAHWGGLLVYFLFWFLMIAVIPMMIQKISEKARHTSPAFKDK